MMNSEPHSSSTSSHTVSDVGQTPPTVNVSQNATTSKLPQPYQEQSLQPSAVTVSPNAIAPFEPSATHLHQQHPQQSQLQHQLSSSPPLASALPSLLNAPSSPVPATAAVPVASGPLSQHQPYSQQAYQPVHPTLQLNPNNSSATSISTNSTMLPPSPQSAGASAQLSGSILPPGTAGCLSTVANGGVPGAEPLDRCNVFVKYLPPDMRDEGLFELFAGCGRITSCKVMLDHKTHTSLGYGFVRFSTPEEALKTIEKMSGHQVGNKTLLCKLSNCSPAPAQTPCNNLYVKPLLPDTTEEQLKALFSVFGRVEECRVMLDKRTGRSRQIGFVRFSMLHEATTALKRMNGARISPDSLPLIVKYAETDAQKAARRARKLAAQNAAASRVATTTPYFPFATQSLGVNQFPYVPPQMGLPGAIYPPGMAMAPYFPPTAGVGLSGMAGLHPMSYGPALAPYPASLYGPAQSPIHPHQAHVLPATAYYASQSNAYATSSAGNLFVFHLPSDIDDTRLAQLFSPFGEVESVKVISDKTTGESKGYGFVKFYRMADAVNAISYMNGYAIGSKHLKVTFKTPSMRL